jgi:hypothetical protein
MQKLISFSSLLLLTTLALVSSMACTKKTNDGKISGTIEIQPDLQKKLSPSAVLYVIARPEGKTSGPPVAVRRFTQPLSFPIEFNITQQDVMLPDTVLEGKFTITARISQSGSATPVKAGDIQGRALPEAVAVGGKEVKVILNEETRSP